jgi:zinc transport system substrate-binding protein
MRLLLSLVLVGSLSGCGALGLSDDGDGDGVQVAASFYPLAYVAERVAGRPVELLTTPGAEPHDFELTIKETAQVAGADLVVYERGFQPAVDAAVDQTAEGEVLDAADVVDLVQADEQDDEHSDEGHEHEHEDGVDPHFWLDPLRMADLGDAVAAKLSDVDPDRAEEYADNAADLRLDLERLDGEYADGLDACERHTVVVSHDAFGYLGKYGLHFEPIAGLSPDAEPTPAHLAQLQEIARDEGVTTVFTETLGSRKLADTLADDLGLKTATLDPIEGVDADSTEDYLSLMRTNLANLKAANGC